MEMKFLVNKLNATCRRALEEAAALAVARSNFHVEIEHFLVKLLDARQSDVGAILRQYDASAGTIQSGLSLVIDEFKRGSTRTPTFSQDLPKVLEAAWMISSLTLGEQQIRSGAILLAVLDNQSAMGTLGGRVPALAAIPLDRLKADLKPLCSAGTGEGTAGGRASPSPAADAAGGAATAAGAAADSALQTYTHDLTAAARAGRIDPIIGRDGEIRQLVDILLRRRQNNPILTGDPGVGKTAIVEGFAQKVVAGDVPEPLRRIAVRTLDLGLLQAGAGVRGEFEDRLRRLIDEVRKSPIPIILFIDEAHTMIGAGGQAGQGDAANLLKPALARGELRTIAATTWAEYKKYFEKDPALARRFQVVKVPEPSDADTVRMMRALLPRLEAHHNVTITDQAVIDAVHLSSRYLPGRQQPDKSLSVLDTACARVAVGQSSTPAAVEAIGHTLMTIETELALLRRERNVGTGEPERIDALVTRRESLKQEQATLQAAFEAQGRLVERIRQLRGGIFAKSEAAENDEIARAEIDGLRMGVTGLTRELEELQGESPLVPLCVDSAAVASVISGWTGIPTGRIVRDDITGVLDLRPRMGEFIIGQSGALDVICKRIRTAAAGLSEPNRPTGVFLLVGPSGVGKTETAATIAELMYGGAREMVTINMSEYQEAHSVSNLKGAPPGYVGYGEGGVLTEAVRRRPYSVVLLDEIEKAHTDVTELFYQVFDKGTLEDGEGEVIDFKSTVIFMTSNLGADAVMDHCLRAKSRPDPVDLAEIVRPYLTRHFKAAFMGRVTVVPYFPLTPREIAEIAGLKLERIRKRMRENHRAELTVRPSAVEAIVARANEVESGARSIDAVLTETLLAELSDAVLRRMAEGRPFAAIEVDVNEIGFVYNFS